MAAAVNGAADKGEEPRSGDVKRHVCFFWDIENVRVSPDCAKAVVTILRDTFVKDGFSEYDFYVACDCSLEKKHLTQALNGAEINVLHTDGFKKNAADSKLRSVMRKTATKMKMGDKVVLITSDGDFAPEVRDIRYGLLINVTLVHNLVVSSALVNLVNAHCTLESLLATASSASARSVEASDDSINKILILDFLPFAGRPADRQFVADIARIGGEIVRRQGGWAHVRFSTGDACWRAKTRFENYILDGRRVKAAFMRGSSMQNSNAIVLQRSRSLARGNSYNMPIHNDTNHGSVGVSDGKCGVPQRQSSEIVRGGLWKSRAPARNWREGDKMPPAAASSGAIVPESLSSNTDDSIAVNFGGPSSSDRHDISAPSQDAGEKSSAKPSSNGCEPNESDIDVSVSSTGDDGIDEPRGIQYDEFEAAQMHEYDGSSHSESSYDANERVSDNGPISLKLTNEMAVSSSESAPARGSCRENDSVVTATERRAHEDAQNAEYGMTLADCIVEAGGSEVDDFVRKAALPARSLLLIEQQQSARESSRTADTLLKRHVRLCNRVKTWWLEQIKEGLAVPGDLDALVKDTAELRCGMVLARVICEHSKNYIVPNFIRIAASAHPYLVLDEYDGPDITQRSLYTQSVAIAQRHVHCCYLTSRWWEQAQEQVKLSILALHRFAGEAQILMPSILPEIVQFDTNNGTQYSADITLPFVNNA